MAFDKLSEKINKKVMEYELFLAAKWTDLGIFLLITLQLILLDVFT